MNFSQLKSYVCQLLEDYRGCFTVSELGDLIFKQSGFDAKNWQIDEVCHDLRAEGKITPVEYRDNVVYWEFVPEQYRVVNEE